MAFYTIRVNLGASSFPLLTELQGQTIIVPGQDEHYDRAVISTTADAEKDKGNPQPFYMQNVVPTTQGLQAIAYTTLLETNLPAATDFGAVYGIQVDTFARILLSPSGGRNYILDRSVLDGWNTNSAFSPGTVPDDVLVTIAQVQGVTYIYYANYGCFYYDTTTKLLTSVTLTGLVAADIVAICSANGQLVAFTNTAVAWSSLSDPTDFVPSVITGAGGGNLQEAAGAILTAYTIASGFIVYCEGNMVSARLSGNTQFPFMFTPVPGSGGLKRGDQVSWESSIADHFVWTNVGLQQVSPTQIKPLLPEIADFIAAKILEEFDPATLTFTRTELAGPLQVAMHVIGLRYIVISYGANYPDYDYCLLYDLYLKRYGKLKITHRDAFEWNYPNAYGALTYDMLEGTSYDGLGYGTSYDDLSYGTTYDPAVKETFAFLQGDGTIKRVDFDYDVDAAAGEGVLLLGKFQYVRNLFFTHLRSQFDVVQNHADFTLDILATLDGKTFQPAERAFLQQSSPMIRSFLKKKTGQNISLLLQGSFNLTSGIIRFSVAGTR